MANKEIDKVKINTTNLIIALNDRNVSMRELGRESDFNWSDKSISRAIKSGEASPSLVRDLSIRLDVDIKYLTGDREIKKISDDVYKRLASAGFSNLEIKTLKLSLIESVDYIQDEETHLDQQIKNTHKHLLSLFKNF